MVLTDNKLAQLDQMSAQEEEGSISVQLHAPSGAPLESKEPPLKQLEEGSISVQLHASSDVPAENKEPPVKQPPGSYIDDAEADFAKLRPGFRFKNRFHIEQSHVLDDMSFSYYYHCKRSTQIAHMLTIPVTNFTVTVMLANFSLLITVNKYPEIIPCVLWGFLTIWYIYLVPWLGVLWGIYLFGSVWAAKYLLVAVLPYFTAAIDQPSLACFIMLIVITVGLFLVHMILPLEHVVWEKASPARRPYEAFISTPLLLSWMALCWVVKYQYDQLRIVVRRSIRWDSTPLRRDGFVIPEWAL